MEELSGELRQAMAQVERRFHKDCTLRKRLVRARGPVERQVALYFCDGMAAGLEVSLTAVAPVLSWQPRRGDLRELEERCLRAGECRRTGDADELCTALVSGDTAVLLEGSPEALILGTKGYDKRSIAEPAGEQVLSGPKEGFCEALMTNLSLLRRRLRTPALRLESLELGSVSHTLCCLCWVEGVTDPGLLAEVKKRLARVDMDGVFSTNYLAECIRDRRRSPVRTTGSTERPDVLAAKLLEGRVGILVEGSPVALTLPFIFLENFQDSRDYYQNFLYAGTVRVLRIIGFVFSIAAVPAFLAILYHHPGLLPDKLLYTISAARVGVPLPAWGEILVLLLFFDLLQEADLCTPASSSQPLSIVGALVLGQAAVDARFVSVPMVILVAVGGIAAMMMIRMRAAVMIFRGLLLGLALLFGLPGVAAGMAALQIYLISIRSFGVPMMYGTLYCPGTGHRDSVLRPPFFRMARKGRFLARNGEAGR